MADEFDKYDFDPDIITRNRKINLDNLGGFLVLYTHKAAEISGKLKMRGVWTDYRGDRLRLGPAPYLSDEQLLTSMNILKDILKN